MNGTHAQRIMALLQANPGLDDDQIAEELSITPRQTVNQICRSLAAQGTLLRARDGGGKIVNRLSDGGQSVPVPAVVRAQVPQSARDVRPCMISGTSLSPDEISKTLIVVPCSKSKQGNLLAGPAGPALTGSLPEELADELAQARRKVAGRVDLDERSLAPALERYCGSLYEDDGREGLSGLLAAGAHGIIISGGYGAILAREPIGMYEAALQPSWWPGRLLERALVAYAERHGILSVRAFAAATSPYAKVLARVSWTDAGVADALLLMPEPRPGGTRISPASIGQALYALHDGMLTSDWRSSYGLRLEVRES